MACDSRQAVKLKPAGWAHAFPCGMPRMKRECSGLVTLQIASELLGLVERHDLSPQHTCERARFIIHMRSRFLFFSPSRTTTVFARCLRRLGVPDSDGHIRRWCRRWLCYAFENC